MEYPAPLPDTDDLPGNEDIRLLEENLPAQTTPESLQKADELFLDMMRRVDTGSASEVENKQRELLAQAKSKLANLIESVEAFGGKIPTHIMKSLGETEEKVELEEELNTMEVNKAESLDIIHFDEFLELLHTERGRQRINRFFKDNEYTFHFRYDKVLI